MIDNRKIIKLKDGLIELVSIQVPLCSAGEKLGLTDKIHRVIFYNRHTAKRRLLEIESRNTELLRQNNDI